MHDRIGRIADRLARTSVERATVAFIGKTMARSAKHRIFLAAYIGVGCALAVQGLAVSKLRDAWLSIPLVMGFFVLSGIRFIFTIPFEIPSNWIFRVTQTDQQRQALNGTRTAMRWFGVAPLFVAFAPFYFLRWTPGIALAHLCFSIVLSLLLIEVLTMEFRKVPFTCTYPSGRPNVMLLWIFYWVAFLLYGYWMATLESWMVKRPLRMVVFYAVVVLMFTGFEWWRRRMDAVGTLLIFDDALDPAVLTLGLGEIAWTTGTTTRVDPSGRLPGARRPSSSHVSRAE